MKLATAAEMRELDRAAVEDYGIPGIVLMENAGRGAVSEVVHAWGPVAGRKFVIFCGKGNNGGDGLVIARHLHNKGAKVAVRLFPDEMKGDAGTNLAIARKMDLDIKPAGHDLAAEASDIKHADVVVDAIFGTGLASDIGEPCRAVIKTINEYARKAVAVDVPSGVDSDKGRIMGAAVRADMTVTFGLPKRGLYLYPGALMAGDVRVVDIGIPAEAVGAAPIAAMLITKELVRGLLPGRPPDSHKGTFGHLFIIAGSAGKTGAAVLAAKAASRSGAGLVTVGVPESLNDIFEEKLTEEMTVPLPETKERTLSAAALDKILAHMEGKTALALGPGISTNPETARLVAELLPRVNIPMVIDADGLNILAMDETPVRETRAPAVLTPHPGEMGRLLGIPATEVQSDRPGAALALAKLLDRPVVLKGARTLVALPGGVFYINTTGNPGMACGGTGDVLTGMIGSFAAQGLSAADASLLGVYAHGLAGDIAAREKGYPGLVAGDLVEAVPAALMSLSE
ncbi:MAG TPA: NAD(P)H-hydrate dehydratase [Nitrospirota bacterium]|nr:NAD(P)H-hydrate dehydratase [Nitrospirota bacterium]